MWTDVGIGSYNHQDHRPEPGHWSTAESQTAGRQDRVAESHPPEQMALPTLRADYGISLPHAAVQYVTGIGGCRTEIDTVVIGGGAMADRYVENQKRIIKRRLSKFWPFFFTVLMLITPFLFTGFWLLLPTPQAWKTEEITIVDI